jgi:steroid delta-isomerase-like uncharacterized protein
MATDVKKLIDDLFSAWNSHDVNKTLSLHTDDCVYENWARESVRHGKKELSAYLNSGFVDIPDYKAELKSVFCGDDWAVAEYVFSGTNAHSMAGIPATGKTFSIRCATVFQLHNGKISRTSDYYNMMTLLQQVGLMPGQPK